MNMQAKNPTMRINTANETRKGVAATESFRNEMVKQGAQTQQMLLVAAQLANREKGNKPLEQIDICE